MFCTKVDSNEVKSCLVPFRCQCMTHIETKICEIRSRSIVFFVFYNHLRLDRSMVHEVLIFFISEDLLEILLKVALRTGEFVFLLELI